MFEVAYVGSQEAVMPTAAPKAAEVLEFATSLAGSVDALDDHDRIDLIHALEVLKCAAEGAQAVVTADFDKSQRALAAARGEAPERQGGGGSPIRWRWPVGSHHTGAKHMSGWRRC